MMVLGVYIIEKEISFELNKTGGEAKNMGILSFLDKKAAKENQFEASYQAYYKPIVHKLAYIVGDVHVAEELAQEAFIKLYESPPKHEQIEPWLRVVAARSAYNYLRDKKRHEAKELDLEQETQWTTESAEAIYLHQNELDLTKLALEALSTKDRTCLMLKHSGYKYAEIADSLEMDPQAVGVLISRAQQKFKLKYEQLEKGGGQL